MIFFFRALNINIRSPHSDNLDTLNTIYSVGRQISIEVIVVSIKLIISSILTKAKVNESHRFPSERLALFIEI